MSLSRVAADPVLEWMAVAGGESHGDMISFLPCDPLRGVLFLGGEGYSHGVISARVAVETVLEKAVFWLSLRRGTSEFRNPIRLKSAGGSYVTDLNVCSKDLKILPSMLMLQRDVEGQTS